MEDYESIEFRDFDRAVSLLSRGGYYLEGFIDDSDCELEKYPIYYRYSKTSDPVAYIYRRGLIEFAEDFQYLSEKNGILRILKNSKKPKKSKRPKNSEFGRIEKSKRKK